MRRLIVEPRNMWQTSASTQLPTAFLRTCSIRPRFLHVFAVLHWLEIPAETCHHGPCTAFADRLRACSLGHRGCASGRRPRAPRQLCNGCMRLRK